MYTRYKLNYVDLSLQHSTRIRRGGVLRRVGPRDAATPRSYAASTASSIASFGDRADRWCLVLLGTLNAFDGRSRPNRMFFTGSEQTGKQNGSRSIPNQVGDWSSNVSLFQYFLHRSSSTIFVICIRTARFDE